MTDENVQDQRSVPTARLLERTWRLHAPEFAGPTGSGSSARSLVLLYGGMTATLLITGIGWSLGTSRARAERLARQMTASLRASEACLRTTVMTDSLTGLANRPALCQRLDEAIRRAEQDGASGGFAVLFLDFDGFKIVNDSLGHEAGDRLLLQLAERLRRQVRREPSAMAARLGGDEFVVLLEQVCSRDDAIAFTQRLQEALRQPHYIDGHELHITASIGLTTNDQGYQRADELLRDADTAMYRAKSEGKARYVLFDRTMHEAAADRLRMEEELRRAVNEQHLSLRYQPVIALESGRLVGFEALVRWEHPYRGTIMPGEFIALAEETGLIVPLGRWVLREACRQLSLWRRDYPAMQTLAISVNLSRRQMLEPALSEDLAAVLREYDLPARCLELEITESLFLEDSGAVTQTLHALRDMDVQLCMDDFGVGYSSLSCLHRFPIDSLKIDRAFVQHMTQRRNYAAVVQAIISLAHNLGIRVVAEGLECAAAVAELQAMECDLGQGYYFGKPMSAGDAEALIRQPLTLIRSA